MPHALVHVGEKAADYMKSIIPINKYQRKEKMDGWRKLNGYKIQGLNGRRKYESS